MRKTVISIVLLGLLLSACATAIQAPVVDHKTPLPHGMFSTPTAAEPETDQPTPVIEFPPAVMAARADLSSLLGIAEETVSILGISASQWPDSCLGLGGPAEICSQQVIDGYKVEMQAIGALFTYRTDQDGAQVRIEFPPVADAQTSVQIARVVLAGQLGLSDPEQLQLLQALPVTWQNNCLGVASEGMTCDATLTSGFRILFGVQGALYEFHTNHDGSQIVQIELP